MGDTIGKIPEFTEEGTSPEEAEDKEVKTEEGQPQEGTSPQEKPAEETEPAGEQEAVKPEGETISDDTSKLTSQVQGLADERQKLLEEIKSLRGERRTLKQQEIDTVDKKIIDVKDELADINPEDVKVLDKYFKARGFVTKEEATQLNYNQVKQEVLENFLNKYPEYKPENDPHDVNWNALQRELSLYKLPQNPRMINDLLERSRKVVNKITGGLKDNAEAKRKLETASHGQAGTVRDQSSTKTLDADKKAMLRSGGFTDEDIKSMENNLK